MGNFSTTWSRMSSAPKCTARNVAQGKASFEMFEKSIGTRIFLTLKGVDGELFYDVEQDEFGTEVHSQECGPGQGVFRDVREINRDKNLFDLEGRRWGTFLRRGAG